MTSEKAFTPVHEYPTLEAAQSAANAVAMHGFSLAVSGTLYMQGGRRFISAVLPMELLFDLTISPQRRRRGEPKPDPSTTRNRPLNEGHVKDISLYLRKNDLYLIPPVILNASVPLDVFAVASPAPTRPCVFVLPKRDALYITDGQHRVEGLRHAAEEKPELTADGIGITLIEEMDLARIHQDFYDAAQTKKLEPSLLVEYDGRAEGNALVRTLIEQVPLFKARTERLSNTIGKNSLMLYSTNHIKGGLFYLLLGEVKGKNVTVMERVNQKIGPAYHAWERCAVAFFTRMTALNGPWRAVAERPLEQAPTQDPVPEMRSTYVHFSGGGLNVLCAVGHAILLMTETISDTFTPEQEAKMAQLANLDWSREGELWQGHIVSTSGTITPHRGNLLLAIAKVKEQLDLPLSKAEQNSLERHLALTAVGEGV
jgi:DGQHR domain-containing protein